ncbi:unnamed protein product [Psylliodes chrysocephalus]|uniref:Uncharacterized protein n=1 Tax=Psylliodes chrysocephalus TaxID=3402493 RepID=A0A9P0D035_9CUCU|nr:unnamed protein product [Psylliodes chrysocephala]
MVSIASTSQAYHISLSPVAVASTSQEYVSLSPIEVASTSHTFHNISLSEAGHVKSSADGIGGYIKKLADDQVKYGLDVTNVDSLLTILRYRVKSVYIDCVTEDEISNIDSILPSNFKPFIGTMKIHQYTWNKLQHNCILFNSLSCCDCSNKSPCINFAMGKIEYSLNDTAGKMNNRLLAKTKKSENSSPKLTKNLKCLEKDVAKDNLKKKLNSITA